MSYPFPNFTHVSVAVSVSASAISRCIASRTSLKEGAIEIGLKAAAKYVKHDDHTDVEGIRKKLEPVYRDQKESAGECSAGVLRQSLMAYLRIRSCYDVCSKHSSIFHHHSDCA